MECPAKLVDFGVTHDGANHAKPGMMAGRGTFTLIRRSFAKLSKDCMMTHPWPVTENEFLLDDALDIAMRYFDLPPDSAEYASVEKFAADAIMDEWKLGVRHKIVLANKAIAVIEDRHPLANELLRVRKAG
jgi:hypothetical protein